MRANRPGANPIVELRELVPAVEEMTVILCDRGLGPVQHGSHPYMRLRPGRPPAARPALCLPSDTAWVGSGTAFADAKRRCTLLVVWYAEPDEPWINRSCPDKVGPSTPCASGSLQPRAWAGSGIRPAARPGACLPPLAGALLALAYGTDAQDRRISPLRTPPKACPVLDTGALAPNHRDPRPSGAHRQRHSLRQIGACCSKVASGCLNPGSPTWKYAPP